MDPLTKMSLAFFFSLVISNLLVDFVLQPDRWVADKTKNKWHSSYLYIHGALAGVLAFVPSLYFCGWILAIGVFIIVCLTHFIIDGFKAHLNDTDGNSATYKDVRLFFVDQTLHILVLILIWWCICGLNPAPSNLYFDDVTIYNVIVILLGYLIVLWPGGVFIGKLMGYIELKANKEKKGIEDDGLKNAGTYIGYLERFLILSFILVDQYTAIGFLVGAKAIFRYTDKRDISEYILTGTLLSYSVAILVGTGVVYLLNLA
ncbi:DUF3307 domain-containing protein [Methanofollis sp. UBA420]|jgi:hypothetical protein|uniref:DUF3307 domain-containing protein n=1 Tax=Methanofollis sp. UBA420 TaxID=1915514 RepID=UPI00316AE456